MTWNKTLPLPEDKDLKAGSLFDVLRIALGAFSDEAWQQGHTAALLENGSTNEGTLHQRLVRSLRVGINAALQASPENDRDTLRTASEKNFRDAMQRLGATLPKKGQQIVDKAKELVGGKPEK